MIGMVLPEMSEPAERMGEEYHFLSLPVLVFDSKEVREATQDIISFREVPLKKGFVAMVCAAGIVLGGCASGGPGAGQGGELPAWVSSLHAPRDVYRAVGFGQGEEIPEAVQAARKNALLQIVESSFGETVRYRYRREGVREGLSTSASVHDFYDAASSGNLFGQRVVHNAVRRAGQGYVAYVMVEVAKKDIRQAYASFLKERRARKDLRLAETRGAVLLETGHYRRALEFYQEKARKDPGNDVWWIGTGAALYRLGDYEKALSATDHGLILNPRSFYGYWNRSSILEKLKRRKEAVEAVRTACRLRPSDGCTRRLEEAEMNAR